MEQFDSTDCHYADVPPIGYELARGHDSHIIGVGDMIYLNSDSVWRQVGARSPDVGSTRYDVWPRIMAVATKI